MAMKIGLSEKLKEKKISVLINAMKTLRFPWTINPSTLNEIQTLEALILKLNPKYGQRQTSLEKTLMLGKIFGRPSEKRLIEDKGVTCYLQRHKHKPTRTQTHY